MLWYIRTLGGGTDTTVAGESLVILLGGTGLGLLLHHFLVLRSLALLRVHLLHWARLGLRSSLSARVELYLCFQTISNDHMYDRIRLLPNAD